MPNLLRAAARTVRNPGIDSLRWKALDPRDDDIVIATYAKCGTTWMQRIVDLLVFQSPEVRPFGDMSPWLDATFFDPLDDDIARLRAQSHRRYIKSHLPFDALPLWDSVKYIHVGRDGRDARLSWQNHLQGRSPELAQRIAEDAAKLTALQEGARTPNQAAPVAEEPRAFLSQWFDELERAPPDGADCSTLTYFGFETTYWRERNLPNLLLVHYNDLQEDLAGEMRRISEFLEIETPDWLMAELVDAAKFSSMRRHGSALYPRLKMAFDRGADRFLNEGVSGRWRAFCLPEDVARYETIARRRASPALVAWLASGRLGSLDPRCAPD